MKPSTMPKSPVTHHATAADRELFQHYLASFIPPDCFDFHAHLFHTDHGIALPDAEPRASFKDWGLYAAEWMGDLAPTAGLFFGFPDRVADPSRDNDWIAEQLHSQPRSRGLMLVRPLDNPQHVADQVVQHGWSGFKVYHVYSNRHDTFQAAIDEFVSDWMWEIADRHGLVIMLHMVRPTALADPDNQKQIRTLCRKYPGAKLVLAHAARGFRSDHTLDGIDALRGLDNVYFDTSAICESAALIAILQRCGPRRLLYGSDFPVSQLRARSLSLGDGFYWLHDTDADFGRWEHGQPALAGIESLLALRQAARLCHLRDDDVQAIFADNARQLLQLHDAPTGQITLERYHDACKLIPGGTQLLSKRPEMYAPERWPAYQTEARGVEVIDLDGRRFIDMSITGIGSTLLGFADPDVNDAVSRRVMLGSMSTLNSVEEVELAELLTKLHPWSQQVRFARTGGEAMAVAVRIARAATARDQVAFCGYHGWADWYLAANLSNNSDDALGGHLLPGLAPNGVPKALAGSVNPFPYNRLDVLEELVKAQGDKLAAIVMEPTRHTPPDPGFLEGVRELAFRCGAVLIFDEITTGWRMAPGGAHLNYGVDPDIAVFSKALGNGFPIAAVLGVRRVMEHAQSSFISSTAWTESVGPTAALATIRKLIATNTPAHIEKIGAQFQSGMRSISEEFQVGLRLGGPACLTTLGFDQENPAALLTLYTRLLLERGFLAGGGFYPTLAHEPYHVDTMLSAVRELMPEICEAIARGDANARIQGMVKHTGFARLT